MIDIKKRVLEVQPEVVTDLAALVAFPSVYTEGEGTPFGKANAECLAKALEICEGYGFRTKNLDNYCGYAEIGEGDEVIGILAHLDVVPVSDSWATDPFALTHQGDKYFGRGAMDDKGPAVCAIHAVRLLAENHEKLNKRVRLILGCNEESGSKCIQHYLEAEEPVDCGFTPDGYFPLIFGEKGVCGGVFHGKSEKIVSVMGGTVGNAVAAKCVFTLRENCIDEAKLAAFFADKEATYTLEGNVLTVYGKSAHSMSPELGVNAISYGFEGLYYAGIDDPFVSAYHDKIGISYNGQKLGIDFEDAYGNLTFNVGLAFLMNGEIGCSIDIRYPITLTPEQVSAPLMKNGEGYIMVVKVSEPLYFSPDDMRIQALLEAYYQVKGDRSERPMVVGGGTYAKSMPNIVAFGAEDMRVDAHIHDDNEFISEASLQFQTEVYYTALENLLKL